MISAVGIKRILFADIDKVTADITPEIAKTLIQAAIKAKDEVLNVHGETWQIEETEASVTGYKNQLTGKNYRYDDVPGEVSPAFSIGQYDWKTKKAFMGGDVIQATSKDVGWKRALNKVTAQLRFSTVQMESCPCWNIRIAKALIRRADCCEESPI